MPRAGLDTEAVVSAAAAIADEAGYANATLAAVAARLGVRTPSLYNHVGGLPELQTLLALRGLESLRRVVTDAAVGRTGKDAVLAIGLAYAEFVRSRPGLYEAVTDHVRRRDERLDGVSNEIVNTILKVLEPFGLSDDEAIHAVRGLRSMVHGFALLELRGGFAMGLPPDDSLRFMLDAFLNGLDRR